MEWDGGGKGKDRGRGGKGGEGLQPPKLQFLAPPPSVSQMQLHCGLTGCVVVTGIDDKKFIIDLAG